MSSPLSNSSLDDLLSVAVGSQSPAKTGIPTVTYVGTESDRELVDSLFVPVLFRYHIMTLTLTLTLTLFLTATPPLIRIV